MSLEKQITVSDDKIIIRGKENKYRRDENEIDQQYGWRLEAVVNHTVRN